MRALIFIEAHGKAKAWSTISSGLGLDVRVVPTGGHFCRFPSTLTPIGISLKKGQKIDFSRTPTGDVRERILSEIDKVPADTPLIIATDNDVEGDVIALDIVELVMEERRPRAIQLMRALPGAITAEGVRKSMSNLTPVGKDFKRLVNSAIQGRARAVSDRWIGASFSRQAGIPVGRVRSAIVGMTYLWNAAPQYTKGLPETGEITFQARGGMGGKPFQARVSLTGGPLDKNVSRLIAIAERYTNRLIPGIVRPRQSLSAAVAPRFGSVEPFNTGDALAYAARHYGIRPVEAMRGLQDAYLAGKVSYPRTESREVGIETAGLTSRLGAACGLPGLDPYYLASPEPTGGRTHEALHPVSGIRAQDIEALRTLVKKNIPRKAEYEREEVQTIMTMMVSRRAFEACREVTLEVGNWSEDNLPASSDLDPKDIEVLRDLEWERETTPSFPWGRSLMTGFRAWPMDSVILDGMMTEEIGRPSTLAAHVNTAMNSGDIVPGAPGALPAPSPQGISSLKRTPKAIWNPATCRMIEMHLENAGDFLNEGDGSLHARARIRVGAWFQNVPDQIQGTLMAALRDEQDAGKPGSVSMSASAPETASADEASVYEMNPDLADPTPYD
ncbi:MAG: DNA topoisomerase [Roseibium sp.]|uniref:DNA topoisomerase n=1 Tax=Roseibium sp. TaxID=1936156 RepID=UPI0032999D29